jgi:hypothetical protein
MRRRRYNLFWLLFGIAFQIAFAEGVLLIIRHFLAEDPEALARYPIVRIVLYVFWTPFIIKNIVDYLREWKAHNAAIDAVRKKAKAEGRKLSRKEAEKAAEDAVRGVREEIQLEEERAERDMENRAWQERVTREQRRENQKPSRKK